MTHDNVEIIGKNVKDMYGSFMGNVVGTITDIDGSIQSVGIDHGYHGLQQVMYEQLVVQDDVVIFIPRWRLDSQRLIREKQLTLRRIKALMDIVAENDDMKGDAEIIHQKYKAKLASLNETEVEIKAKLEERLSELNAQLGSAKMLHFDAKVQYKSDEITESTFEIVKSSTTSVIEHVTHESAEISNIKNRIADLEHESEQINAPQDTIQKSAMTYLGTSESAPEVQTVLPEVPAEPSTEHSYGKSATNMSNHVLPEVPAEPSTERPQESDISAPAINTNIEQSAVPFAFPKPPRSVALDPAVDEDNNKNDWLARMEAQ